MELVERAYGISVFGAHARPAPTASFRRSTSTRARERRRRVRESDRVRPSRRHLRRHSSVARRPDRARRAASRASTSRPGRPVCTVFAERQPTPTRVTPRSCQARRTVYDIARVVGERRGMTQPAAHRERDLPRLRLRVRRHSASSCEMGGSSKRATPVALGARWFGDGGCRRRCRVDGTDVSPCMTQSWRRGRALERRRAAARLPRARTHRARPSEQALAIADLLRARLDSVTSATASPFVLAGQERGLRRPRSARSATGRTSSCSGASTCEARYPRFASRYAPDPAGVHVPIGRQSRTVIAVDVGSAQATVADADRRITIDPADELATLTALRGARASVRGRRHAP